MDNKHNMVNVAILMIVTGIIVYYLYIRPEAFECDPNAPNCQTCCRNLSSSTQPTNCQFGPGNQNDPKVHYAGREDTVRCASPTTKFSIDITPNANQMTLITKDAITNNERTAESLWVTNSSSSPTKGLINASFMIVPPYTGRATQLYCKRANASAAWYYCTDPTYTNIMLSTDKQVCSKPVQRIYLFINTEYKKDTNGSVMKNTNNLPIMNARRLYDSTGNILTTISNNFVATTTAIISAVTAVAAAENRGFKNIIEGFDCDSNPSEPGCTTSTTPNSTNPTSTPAYTCPPPTEPIPKSIISRYFGIGFNVYQPITAGSTANKAYLIEHIPTTFNGTTGGMYAVSSAGLLTIMLRNDSDTSQHWSFTATKDASSTLPNQTYIVIQPLNFPSVALQYESGNLALRPYTSPGFEGQRWITSQNIVTRGVPVLNYSPASMFSPEFDPYSTTSAITGNGLNQQNNQQVSDVINAVKSGIQQYLTQASSTQQSGQVSASSLGNKDTPLNIKLNLGSGSVSGFANVSGSTTDNDILSILNKYEANASTNNGTNSYYSNNDLQNQMDSYNGCKLLNINDYTSNRVSSCNCKL